MNKKLKLIIILSAIVVVFVIISLFNVNKNYNSKLSRYLRELDFKNYNNTFLYTKQISSNNLEMHNEFVKKGSDSEYEILYFNIDTYQLTKDKITYADEITKNLTSTFDYKNDNLMYTYRINLNNTNIVIDGTYNIKTEEFICTPTFSYQMNIENSLNDICDKIKLEIEDFKYELKMLIKKPELLKYMKEK